MTAADPPPGAPGPKAEARGRLDPEALARSIKAWGRDLGFQQVGITGTDLGDAESRLLAWLDAGRHGEMDYMARHGTRRSRPAVLIPGTRSVVCVRMDYLPERQPRMAEVLEDSAAAFVSRYALGRDYHKTLRRRLQRLADRITAAIGPFGHRAFVDSAPVMEKPLAERAGLGWTGKHTNLIHRSSGSWFFLGELYTDLDLPHDQPARDHCGECRACLDICPTRAIVAPYQLDARLCISYLTIEHRGSIPEPLRPLMGNRVYGCDDCQLVCPWNRFTRLTAETDFLPRGGWTRPPCSSSSPGTRPASRRAPRARRFAGSVTRVGCATSRWRSATAQGVPPRSVPCVHARRTRARWCASTSTGRSDASAPEPIGLHRPPGC